MDNKISKEGFLTDWYYNFCVDDCYLDEYEKRLNAEKSGKGYGVFKESNSRALERNLAKTKRFVKEKMTSFANAYLDELRKTDGLYRKRDNRILESVTFIYKVMKDMLKDGKAGVGKGLAKLYTRLYELLTAPSMDKVFSAAAKSYQKDDSTYGTLTYLEYISLVYTLESMATILGPKLMDLGLFKVSTNMSPTYVGGHFGVTVDTDFQSLELSIKTDYPTLYKVGMRNALIIVKRYENTKNPYDAYNKAIVAEKKGAKEAKEIAFTTIGIVSLIVAGVLVGVPLAISAVRRIIYQFGCMKVDISKSLIDQSYVIAINIKELEKKLSTLDKNSKEYKELEKIIVSQREWLDKMISTAKKLADVDSRSLDEIKEINDADEDDINDDSGDDGSDSSGDDDGKFDI